MTNDDNITNSSPLPKPRADLTQLAMRLRNHAEQLAWRATLATMHDDLISAAEAVEKLAALEDDKQ